MNYAPFFLEPSNPKHRQYEALRSFFVERLPGKVVAQRFGYTEGSFRILVHRFKKDPNREFFLSLVKGPKDAPKRDPLREKVIALRKANLSIYDIQRTLAAEGLPASHMSIHRILKEEGFGKLPRRADDERPSRPRPENAPVADVKQLDLSARILHTKFGGLFLFLPTLCDMGLDRLFDSAGFPGSKMIPAGHAMRALLALKLFGSARHSHVMSYVLDEGLALFTGLNVIPKRSFLTEYSCRIDPAVYPKVMRAWFDGISQLGLPQGSSFDLDFHTIPFHGEDALVEKHYVSKRSRRQKGVLAFLAQDAGTRVLCYADANVRKNGPNDQILKFVKFWKTRTGHLPDELIFDCRLTTHKNLAELHRLNIRFITLRKRSRKMLQQIHQMPLSAWRQIQLEGVSRIYRTPRILSQSLSLKDYPESIRQIVITDLGHEEPTFLLTNQLTASPAKLIERYAQRMIIENSIQDSIDFFHMDALSSAVPMKVDCDVQLTLMASSLYRLLGLRIAEGYEHAKSRKIFRDFIDATATILISENEITVRFQKRAHNPLLIHAGFHNISKPVPWLGGRRLTLVFG
jgi:hypothetical protein